MSLSTLGDGGVLRMLDRLLWPGEGCTGGLSAAMGQPTATVSPPGLHSLGAGPSQGS
jgi:hypothetical protein